MRFRDRTAIQNHSSAGGGATHGRCLFLTASLTSLPARTSRSRCSSSIKDSSRRVMRPGYSIDYSFADPPQLSKPSLRTRLVGRLFFLRRAAQLYPLVKRRRPVPRG